jgi:carbon monoxide dehydrogenase subunit G
MVHIQRTFTVEQPLEVVVEYLRDFGHAEQWDPGTVSCTRVGSGPFEVGTSWDNVSKVRGRQTQLSYRLERMESGRLTFVGRNKTATSTDDLTFTAVSDRTSQIHYDANIVFHGIAKLADPFLRREFERLGDETVRKMTQVLNAL